MSLIQKPTATAEPMLVLSDAPARRCDSWPAAAIAMVVLFVYSGVLMFIGVARTGFDQLYNLDDTYIHLAISRNLAFNHTWGINPGEFAGASSSPLWTVILAGTMKVFGAAVWLPLAINLVVAPLIVIGLWMLLRPYVRGTGKLAMAIIVIGVMLPLPLLLSNAMEQTLQIALILGLMHCYLKLYLAPCNANRDRPRPVMTGTIAWAALLAALAVGSRLESLFLVFIACGLLLLRRRWLAAIIIGAAAWVPVAIYAAYSVHHGGTWLPYSVLVKGNSLRGVSPLAIWQWLRLGLLYQLVHTLVTPIAVSATLLLVLLWRDKRDSARATRFMLLVFIGSTLIHGQLAWLVWFSRYEAYLYAIGLVAVIASAVVVASSSWASGSAARSRAIAIVLVILNLPILIRPAVTDARVIYGARNIQQQQMQMGLFVSEFYPHHHVALNDIGAVAWFGNVHITDLWGLADLDVCRMRRDKTYDTAAIDKVCRDEHVDIAMIYPRLFLPYGGIPKSWRAAGAWTIQNNYAVGASTVVFYVTRPEDRPKMVESLAAFEAREPRTYGTASQVEPGYR